MNQKEIKQQIRYLEQCDGRDGDCTRIKAEVDRLRALLPKITVGNVRNELLPDHMIHLYCGRGAAPPGMIKANLGNPFPMSDESQRNKVCEDYDAWLHTQQAAGHLRVMERIIQRVNEGKSVALYCHCFPKRCHTETIKEYVETNVNFG